MEATPAQETWQGLNDTQRKDLGLSEIVIRKNQPCDLSNSAFLATFSHV